MNQVFFAHNAAVVRATFPVSLDDSSLSLEEFTHASAGYLERFLALVLFVAVGPLLLLFALINKRTSRGPAFFIQVRVGKRGALFPVYKLRTMIDCAEASTGPVLSWKGDPRITSLGDFLRKTHLDELPQLLNIIRGEMSFVGPRPERPEFVNQFSQDVPNYTLRTRVKPGITGLAQICCAYDVSVDEKLRYDLVYIRNKHSLRMIGFILYRTFMKMFLQQ